jgi:hypothetical protein
MYFKAKRIQNGIKDLVYQITPKGINTCRESYTFPKGEESEKSRFGFSIRMQEVTLLLPHI